MGIYFWALGSGNNRSTDTQGVLFQQLAVIVAHLGFFCWMDSSSISKLLNSEERAMIRYEKWCCFGPPFALLSILLSFGIVKVSYAFLSPNVSKSRQAYQSHSASSSLSWLPMILVIFVCLQLQNGYPSHVHFLSINNEVKVRSPSAIYAEKVFEPLPAHSKVIVSGDIQANALLYYAPYRPDVSVIHVSKVSLQPLKHSVDLSSRWGFNGTNDIF